MGFIRQTAAKLTGADIQADAADRGATAQADATRQAAEASSKAAQESAAQSARLQEQAAARNAAQGAAADAINTPLDNPDVQLSGPQDQSAAATTRKRRSAFGVSSAGTGVNI